MGEPGSDPQEQPPLGHIEPASRARRGGHIAFGSNAYKLAEPVRMDIFVDFETETSPNILRYCSTSRSNAHEVKIRVETPSQGISIYS